MESIFEGAARLEPISKAERNARELELRHRLLEAQARLAADARSPLIVVFAGVDGAGKGELVNKLIEWMDARTIVTHAYSEPSQEESERPEYWRYWRDLPCRGSTGIFLSAWYHRPLLDRVYEDIDDEQLDALIQRAISFERELIADGALVVKFWLHLGKDAQEARFRALEKDPVQAWRVTPLDWKHWRMYDRFVHVAAHLIEKTSTRAAPWTIIDGADARQRELTVGESLLRALLAGLPGGVGEGSDEDLGASVEVSDDR